MSEFLKNTWGHMSSVLRWSIAGLFLVTFVYWFVMFFAYDMNPNFVNMDNCYRDGGIWDGDTKECSYIAR